MRGARRYREWLRAVQDAYEKDAKNPDTLANLVTVGLHMGKNTSRFNKCVGF